MIKIFLDSSDINAIKGIYQIQSRIKPSRIYIGSAVNITKRWAQHLERLRKRIHHSRKLQRHYNKYGESDLMFSMVLTCDREHLIEHEQYFLDTLKPYFNTSPNAYSQLGLKHSEATKKKISEATKEGMKRYFAKLKQHTSL